MAVLIIVVTIFCFLIVLYYHLYYPTQQIDNQKKIEIDTPDRELYHNDCLHPSIRKVRDESDCTVYYLVQTPYYARNKKIETPLLYKSEKPDSFVNGLLVEDSPVCGFNSDPCLFYESNKLFVIWRECETPLCKSIGCTRAIVGKYTIDGLSFSDTIIYIRTNSNNEDLTLCPIVQKRGRKYYIYTAILKHNPKREVREFAIWEGSSLLTPNFSLCDRINCHSFYVCDKLFQFRLQDLLFFIPKPLMYDLWHFDLFEYQNILFMISCSEFGDNVMLHYSKDYKHFRTIRKPLVNNHANENRIRYRQYYYKPTAFIEGDLLYLYYTANDKNDTKKNSLFLSIVPMKSIIKLL